jgi:hypothetical protein
MIKDIDTPTPESFCEIADNLRKEKPTEWIFLSGKIGDNAFQYKAQGTHIQKFIYNGIVFSNQRNEKIQEFKRELKSMFLHKRGY